MANREEYADEDDLLWLHPPKNVHDVGQWNVYWINQISRNSALFWSDMFINELWLARTMINFGFQTVLTIVSLATITVESRRSQSCVDERGFASDLILGPLVIRHEWLRASRHSKTGIHSMQLG
jgi:hypothetical protein